MPFMKVQCGHVVAKLHVVYVSHSHVSFYVILVWNTLSRPREFMSKYPFLDLLPLISSLTFVSKCNDINRKYFFNQPIVSYGEEGVTINYSRLEIMNQPYVSPVVVSTSPFHGQPSQKYVATAVASPAPIVTAIPVPPSPQVFQVTIPEGYTPGSHLTVSAPNGQQISVGSSLSLFPEFSFSSKVTIPPNSRPGDILNIQT
jgi:hypothetical protein